MAFSEKQVRALRQNVKRTHLRSRQIQGRDLTYIEGWHAIDEANRIFGFDAWDRETLETKCVLAREIRGQFTAVYLAKVRISVRIEGAVILRDGQGTGEAQGATPGEAHDKALKTAETDATKRALATFGRPFGLGLYLGTLTGHSRGLGGSHAKPDPTQKYPKPVAQRTPTQPAVSDSKSKETPFESAAIRASLGSADRHPSQPPARTATSSTPRPGIYIPGLTPLATGSGPAGPRRHAQPSEGNDNEPLRIDKSVLTIGAPKRLRDKRHLLYVTTQPCLVCGRTPSDAHHLRFAQPRALSRKVSDEFTVPLCRGHHRQLHHSGNEVDWWQVVDIDPLPVAEQLWQESRARKNAPLVHSAAQSVNQRIEEAAAVAPSPRVATDGGEP